MQTQGIQIKLLLLSLHFMFALALGTIVSFVYPHPKDVLTDQFFGKPED